MITESMKKRLTALIDPEYERAVNKLIPTAVKFANKQFGKGYPKGSVRSKEVWAEKWNLCFHRKREALYREREGKP